MARGKKGTGKYSKYKKVSAEISTERLNPRKKRRIKTRHLTKVLRAQAPAAFRALGLARVVDPLATDAVGRKIEPHSTEGRVNIATARLLLKQGLELLNALK